MSPCAFSQLLKALTPEENTQCQHGLYFQDGQRRVDYVLTYPVKKPGGGRSCRHSAHLLTENAVARSLRRGPQGRDERLRHHQAQRGKGSTSAVADVELGCPGETVNGHEDHKAFRREEFEGKLRDMGLELEKDEDVSLHLYPFSLSRNTSPEIYFSLCLLFEYCFHSVEKLTLHYYIVITVTYVMID